MKDSITIHPHTHETPVPYDLLLLADPSKELIDQYITTGQLYLAKYNTEIVGCYVLYPWDSNTTEIKNIAIHEKFQNQGIGSLLLKDAILRAKNGFIKTSYRNRKFQYGAALSVPEIRIQNFRDPKKFLQNNYPEPIWENGIECTDMILLTMEL